MKRIAIISNYADSLVNFRGHLIQALVEKGLTVFALAPDYSEKQRSAVAALGAEPIDYSLSRSGMNPIQDSLDTLKLIQLLRRLRPDATLGYFIKPVIYGTFAAWVARVPRRFVMVEGLGFVFTETGAELSTKRKILRSVVARMYAFALARAEKAIFLNPDDIEEFVSKGVVEKGKTHCLGGIGVDLKEWPEAPPVLEPVTFLLVARLLREKGVLDYIEAARAVKSRYPQARFVLLGDLDPNPGSLTREQARSWVEEGLIEWPGYAPVQPWLAQTSVFVLPSYREGVPRSTQEALAMGRAVITTDVPGCRETVVSGQNGFLVPVRDPVALSQAMIQFIEQPALITEMGSRSRALAEARFDVHKVNADLLSIMGLH